MVPTQRAWSEAQIHAATTYIEQYVRPDCSLAPCAIDGARLGEHCGVKFLVCDHGPVEVLEDDTPDAAMTALLEAYNAAYSEGFPS